MYYNSNNNNNNYYNSYKQEMQELEAYNKQENIQKIIKLALIVLTIILFISGAYFLYKYFYPTINTAPIERHISMDLKQQPSIVIRESDLPQSIQMNEVKNHSHETTMKHAVKTQIATVEEKTNMSAQDIALIVQIIMSQMNTRNEIPLEEQLAAIEKKKFEHHSLKESNHYNKVILTSNESNHVQNSALMELTSNINSMLSETSKNENSDNYEQAITKEVQFRTNEMRVIIVQKGDTLSRIAKKAYGDYDAYPKIFAANPEIIKNPNQIFVGQRLRIPS